MSLPSSPLGPRGFKFVDGERLIRFGSGALAEAPELLEQRGFGGYTLLSTARARGLAGAVEAQAREVVEVDGGAVPELAAALRAEVGGRPVVALGGGRVVDVAKAIAGADGLPCAAIPTTLAGSPMTPFHRLPSDAPDGRLVRPSLVIADPDLMASAPLPLLAASAMNALAHAFESLYTPLANPVAEGAALAGSNALARGLADGSVPARGDLSLGAVLAGYAVGTTGFAVHHATCQTIVRVVSTPHAGTNAVILPHSVAMMGDRAPAAVARFSSALGADAVDAPAAVAGLARLAGATSLAALGVRESWLGPLAKAIAEHPALGNTPPERPSRAELEALLAAAFAGSPGVGA